VSLLLLIRFVALVMIASATAAFYVFAWRDPIWSPSLARHEQRLAASLAFLRKPAISTKLVSAQLTLCPTLVASTFAFQSPWPSLLAAALAFWPAAALAKARMRRIERLEAQLDGWMVALANALRGTPSLGDALSSTTSLVSAPLREEIDQVLKESQLGIPLDQALDAASLRIGSRTFAAAMLTLRIARSSGGSVSDCLESSAAALREMIRLDGVLRSKTAEGKGQALVISVLPLPFFGLLQWIDPRFLVPLTSSTMGQLVLCAAAVMWLAGVLLARRVVQVDL
jgi:tight adherence protein B